MCFPVLAQERGVQIKEIGTPFINSYNPEEQGAHQQTYSIAQSEGGLLYFGNVTGILEFDGQLWRVDRTMAEDAFKDVAVGPDGRIYGVTKSEFGYLYPDRDGELAFESLRDKAPEGFNKNGTLFQVETIGNQVVFKAGQSLLLYDIASGTTSLITTDTSFSGASKVGNDFFIFEQGKGLMSLRQNKLMPVLGGEALRNLGLRHVLSFGTGELLMVTVDNSLYRFSGGKLSPWETEVSEFLRKERVYSAVSIDDRYFAFGTQHSGIVIIDKSGRLVQKIDKTMGLHDGLVEDMMVDKDGNLWAAQYGAISHIILNSPVSLLDERHGIDGYVLYFARHKETTYVSSMKGVFSKEGKKPWQRIGAYEPFQPFPGLTDITWMFINAGDDFFAAGNQGLIQIVGRQTKSVYRGERLWASAVFQEGQQIITGSVEGNLFLAEKSNGEWTDRGKVAGFNHQMDFLARAEDGNLWMTDSGSGVFKIYLNEEKDSVLSVRSYGTEDGLPEVQRNRVFRHKSGLVFATARGIYTYNSENDRFEPAERFNKLIGEDYVFRFIETKNGSIYASLDPGGKALLTKEKGGDFAIDFAAFARIAGHNSEYVSGLGGDDLWVGSSGIRHYQHDFPKQSGQSFQAHIRTVRVSNKADSLIFGGVGSPAIVELRPGENALDFSYTAASYDEIDRLQFQSYLEGTEDNWSAWTSKVARNYTNLPHGTYTFRVRARDLYGRISAEDAYTFVISTPWYFTLWAYLGYAIMAAFMIWGIVRFYSRKLKQEKIQLEQAVAERTELILRQKEAAEKDKELIQQQADRLKELDEVKSRFFANISHELRTPLTLINAPLESLIENGEIESPEVRETLEVARKNGVSLLSLVEEILDLAKLDAGKLKLVENPVRIYECLTDIIESYAEGMRLKGINFEFDFLLDRGLTLLMDTNKCHKILNNLLSNALKFTPEKGHVALSIRMAEDQGKRISLRVTDTGPGIHPDDLPHIFDRYYQSEQPGKKAEGGTGIGLALARELAALLGGSLTARSELGQGSTFTFGFPLKEVEAEVISQADVVGKPLIEALDDTIGLYTQKFGIDKPVLLVTEDHPEMRAFIAKTLSPYFAIEEAPHGKAALQILGKVSVDIVISDVMMPEMDGFELLKAIKADKALHQVSLVMLTARAEQEDKLEALTLGIDDYLTKPFSAAEFLARIKNILENRIKVIREFRQLEESSEAKNGSELQHWIDEYGLSEREVDVMKLLAKRYTNAEMADKLCVSQNTVKFHLKNLYLKLGISSRAEAMARLEVISQ